MKRTLTRLATLLTAALFATAFSAQAQEAPDNYVSYPLAFIDLQGGAQVTPIRSYNNWKLITPTASVGFGVHFTPVVGARLHLNGMWDKSVYMVPSQDVKYKFNYKYATTDLDLMINVINLFTKNDYHPINAYLIGGIGLNYVWGNDDVPGLSDYNTRDRMSHNFRVGGMVDVKVTRNLSVNFELSANSLHDRFNAVIYNRRMTHSNTDDWQITAQLGVSYKFGLPHKLKGDPNSNIIVDPTTIGAGTETGSANTNVNIDKPAPAPTPAPTPAPVVVDNTITRNIFFGLRETKIPATEMAKLAEVANWLKEHPSAKVTITGYADKGTGNANINARYAKQRAESVTRELVKRGVQASRITTDSKGDTIQPFNKNDENRVTVVIGKE